MIWTVTKQLEIEQGLYSQVVKIIQKDLKYISENKNKNEAKFKFQGQYARSQRWFDIEFDCNEVNFSTHDPDLFKKPFQIHKNKQDIFLNISSFNQKFKICGNVKVSQ